MAGPTGAQRSEHLWPSPRDTPRGHQSNQNGRLLRTIFPDATTTSQEWNPNGQRTASTDALARRTTYDYDELGRLNKTTYPDATTETLAYDAENHRTSRTDALGRVTQYTYDPVGRVLTTTAPDNTTVTNAYDQAGNLISTTNEAGKTTTYAYDAANRRISTTDPLGHTTYTIYDPDGRQIETIAPDHTATNYVYNDAGDLLETDYADNTHTSAEFDDLGRQISKTDELGHKTVFAYDALGRLTSVTDAANQTTRYAYDEQGNQITQTDANGHITHFAYDNRGRITDRMLPDGTTEHRNYDSAGQLLTRADFAGHVTSYTYDASGRLLTRKYPDNSLVTFTYDAAGQRKTVTDTRGVTTLNYDNRGHVSSLIYPDARELDYTYDPRGMRSGITAKVGTRTLTTTNTFDDAGRLATLSDPLSRAYGAQYDANGNRTSLSYPNTQGTSYTYDTRGRLTGLVTKEPGSNGNIAQSYAYTLDSAGKRTRIEESDGTVRQYGYDSVNRLTSEAVSGPTNYSNTFGYDPVGNRLAETSTGNHPGTVNYSYDNRDQLALENGTAYSYDGNGNLTAKTGEATYTWDFENRLKRVSLQDGSIVDHLYDADGNRVQTKVTPAGGGAATVTNYLVDTTGNLSQVIAETDGTGALNALYVRAYDELLAVLRPTGTSTWATRYVHVDGLGSVRVLTDETGVVTDTRDYEAFGSRNETAGSDPLAFGFAGEPFDSLSKLAYHRARWMDPRVGRFISMDRFPSLRRIPGTLHRYGYVRSNPITRRDPSGLEDLIDVSVSVNISSINATLAEPAINGAAIINEAEAALELGELETAQVEAEIELEAEAEIEATEAECAGGQCLGNVCFAPETPVATESGLQPIANIRTGDLVWSEDPSTGIPNLRRVVRQFVTPNERLADVELVHDDGAVELIRATPTHLFWTEDRGWTPVENLHVLEAVRLLDGSRAVVGGIQREENPTTVYNIEVEENHTYFVGGHGMLVHNACDPNKLNHIFGQARHHLEGLVQQLGSQQATFDAVEAAVQQEVTAGQIGGVFETTVNIGGSTVTVVGNVINGIVRIGTFYI